MNAHKNARTKVTKTQILSLYAYKYSVSRLKKTSLVIWKVVFTTDTESALSCKNDRKICACYFVVMPLISKQKNHKPTVTVSHADPHSTACTSIYKRLSLLPPRNFLNDFMPLT